MSTVLAAIDESPTCPNVLAAARAFADVLGASVEGIHVREAGQAVPRQSAEAAGVGLLELEGEPASALIEHVRNQAVEVVVVGARDEPGNRRPVGHLALALVSNLMTPVLVVPPPADTTRGPVRFRRVLVPLEGTPETTTAMTDALERFAAAGLEIIALHVFDAETVPRFWDAAGHAEDSFTASFTTRWCDEHDVDLHLRRGDAAQALVELAASRDVDLIALGWSQDLTPGHAAVVRAALAESRVPVLLVPVG